MNLPLEKVDTIIDELYNFQKPGALSFPNVLSREERTSLRENIKSERRLFRKVPRVVGSVLQEMNVLSLEDIDPLLFQKSFLHAIEKFKQEYRPFYRQLAEKAGFEENEFNSMGINWYGDGSCGITPHQDYERDRDLTSIFILNGQARFGVCTGREGTAPINPVYLDSAPGSLIMLRAARNHSEQQYRPLHFVEQIQEERISLVVRRRS